MLNTETHKHRIIFNLAVLLGLLMLSLGTLQALAQDQTKPGPELKKFEAQVGEWSYEGTGYTNPFGPAGKFKGKTTSRMVLGGFFLETRWNDKNETGYVSQGVVLQGYDPVTKEYFSHVFDNEGSARVSSLTIEGNTWTGLGRQTDKNGKVYKTRDLITLSADGRTFTEIAEYSTDDGKTWAVMFKITGKLVKK